MDETFELDFFLRNLLDDLQGITPSLGCTLSGKVAYSDATAYGQANTYKNQLFLFFAELAQRFSKLELQIHINEAGEHWDVVFEMEHPGVLLEEVPHWDPRLFKENENKGFKLLMIKPPMAKRELPVILWDKALEVFTLPDLLEEALEDFKSKSQKRIQAIHNALDQKDYQEVRKNAHGIKGAARNLFLKRVAKWAWALESDCLQEEPWDKIGELAQKVEASFEEFLAYDYKGKME